MSHGTKVVLTVHLSQAATLAEFYTQWQRHKRTGQFKKKN